MKYITSLLRLLHSAETNNKWSCWEWT